MPKWGLTEYQRGVSPWGLAPNYLRPGKVITDPIHGDVYITELERLFVDSEPFQRLRRLKQLGNTHLVYPGATHSRFSHSLGAIRVAQDLMDAILDQRNDPHPEADVFQEWEEEVQRLAEHLRNGESTERTEDSAAKDFLDSVQGFQRRIAEAVIAARLGSLLHDLCHVPFGHTLEDELGILDAHDENEARFDDLWERFRLPEELDIQLAEGGLYGEVRQLILSKVDLGRELQYPFVEDVVGNTICADLLDYLERDHRMTGLPVALGRRFVSAFYVRPTGDPDIGRHMVLRIRRPDGRERTDVVTEVLKYLRFRYELSERALVHHAKLGADAMVGKALEMWYDALWVESAEATLRRQRRLSGKTAATFRAPRWLSDMNIDVVRERFKALHGAKLTRRVDVAARKRLDSELTRYGDDELLLKLTEISGSVGPAARLEAVRQLARGLQDRRIFKSVATQHRPPHGARRTFERWGTPEERRRLEEDAANWGGLEHRWQVLLWIPPETMRLKIADVLVDDGNALMTFFEYENRGRGRGSDIYKAHEALWAIGVYLAPEYARPEEQYLTRLKVVARIAKRLNITFTQFETDLGKHAYEWPDRVAAREAIRDVYDPQALKDRPSLVEDLLGAVQTAQVQARGGPPIDDPWSESWSSLFARYTQTALAQKAASDSG
jgi:HD superfamily phosphohydrolase